MTNSSLVSHLGDYEWASLPMESEKLIWGVQVLPVLYSPLSICVMDLFTNTNSPNLYLCSILLLASVVDMI